MNKNKSIKKPTTALIFAFLSFVNINLFAATTITPEKLTTIQQIENIPEKLATLESLIPQVVESGPLLRFFADILQDLVNERNKLSEIEITSLKNIISQTLYNQKVQQATDIQFVMAKGTLSRILPKVETPLTFSEEMQNLRRDVANPVKRRKLQENPDEFMDRLTAYVTQRTDKTKEEKDSLESVLKTVRASRIFTDPDHVEQLNKLIEMVPQPVTLYEEIYNVYLDFKAGRIRMSAVKGIITKYQKAKKEEQEKSEEILTLLLKSMIYNLRLSKNDQNQASNWLKTVVSKEIKEVKKEPTTYSAKVTFYTNKAFKPRTLEDPKRKAKFLGNLNKLVEQKMQGTPTDMENLAAVLNYLNLLSQHSELFDEAEKLQISTLLTQVEIEASVSEKLTIIFGLLGKVATEPAVKTTILKLTQEIVTSIINKMKEEKKVPEETTTLRNLITVYLKDAPAFAANKAQIEKWQTNLKKAEDEIKKPEKEKKPAVKEPTAPTPPFVRPTRDRPMRSPQPTTGRPGMRTRRPIGARGY